jgi:cyanophycinase
VGFIVLEGGAEFGGRMAMVDRQAIKLAGGFDSPIRIIPAAAAPDQNHRRAGRRGVTWFQHLGATDVSALDLIDRRSADDQAVAAELLRARLIYLLGGFPHHLGQILQGSRSWQAMRAAYSKGAVIAGSSAGAMVLCETYYDPSTSQLHRGLNLVSGVCMLPHHETFGKDWAPRVRNKRAGIILVGIDEQTGAINDAAPECWRVRGKGKVTVYQKNAIDQYDEGQAFRLPITE